MNEQQLVDRLARAADTLPGPAATSLARIQSRAQARRRRRQVLAVAAVTPVVILVAVAVALVLPAGLQQPIIEPLERGSEAVAALELADDAVWRSPEVADVAGAVELFAEQALGWSDVSVELATDEVGPVWVTIVGPEQRKVEGLFTPTPDEGVWQLMQLGEGPGVQQFEPWSVTIRPPTAAVSADLYVRYEGQTWHLPLGGEQLQQREVRLANHGLPEGDQIDAVLIVYRDTASDTLDAVGGHYGTGTDVADQPTAAASGSLWADQTAPTVDDLADEPLMFDVYAVTPPAGWQHASSSVLHDSYAAALGILWVHTLWTPDGRDLTGDHGTLEPNLVLRQTAESDGGPGGEVVELANGTLARVVDGAVRWKLGDTYLELSAHGLEQEQLVAIANTAQPIPR